MTASLARLGVPFEETTTDGRKCTTTVTQEGDSLITSQKGMDGSKDVKAVGFIFADEDKQMTIAGESI